MQKSSKQMRPHATPQDADMEEDDSYCSCGSEVRDHESAENEILKSVQVREHAFACHLL